MAEKAIIGKMTFYDVVTLVVPSALVCYKYSWSPMEQIDSWEYYIAQFGVLLMVGLLLKSVGAFWSSWWFRNNTEIIKQEREEALNIGGDPTQCRWLDIIFFDPLKFICGPLMRIFYMQDRQELSTYYDKYDIAAKQEYYNKRIEILESHVAFLQTWIVALVVFAFETKQHVCCIIVACYVCVVLMLTIQRKIYNMVWEAKEK